MRSSGPVPARDLASVRQASKEFNIPRRTLYGWIAAGKIWHIRIGGQIFVNINDDALRNAA